MLVESKEILKVLSRNHRREMRGKMGGSAMCICGEGCGGTSACGEMSGLVEYVEKLEAENHILNTSNHLREAEVNDLNRRYITAVNDRVGGLQEIRRLQTENQRLREANRWIPVGERLPLANGGYEVTLKPYGSGSPFVCFTSFWEGRFETSHEVMAWRELPEPYQGDL